MVVCRMVSHTLNAFFEEHFRRVLAKKFQGILQPDGAITVVPCLSTAAGLPAHILH